MDISRDYTSSCNIIISNPSQQHKVVDEDEEKKIDSVDDPYEQYDNRITPRHRIEEEEDPECNQNTMIKAEIVAETQLVENIKVHEENLDRCEAHDNDREENTNHAMNVVEDI